MTTHTDLIARLRVIANAIADGNYSELTMRIPAEPDRDADIVVMRSALALESLEQQVAALTSDKEHAYTQLERMTQDKDCAWQNVHILERARQEQDKQVAALTKERNALQDKLNAVVTVGIREREQLVAAQAREAKLRDAAKAVLEVGMGSDFEALNAALALPTDDSALIERLKKEREKVITWIDNNYQDLANLDELFEAIRSMT